MTKEMILTNSVKELTILFICLMSLLSCSDVIKTDKNMIGLQEHDVVVKLNNPSFNKVITLTENSNLPEYESNLYALFTNLKTNDTVQIKELLWKRDKNTEAVWLKLEKDKWIVIDHLKWSKNINF